MPRRAGVTHVASIRVELDEVVVVLEDGLVVVDEASLLAHLVLPAGSGDLLDVKAERGTAGSGVTGRACTGQIHVLAGRRAGAPGAPLTRAVADARLSARHLSDGRANPSPRGRG